MAYDRKVSVAFPAIIVLIIDDSFSMADLMAGTQEYKYTWVERYFGVLLREFVTRSTEIRGDLPVIKPRYFIEVITYGSDLSLWGDGFMDIGTAVERFAEGGETLGLGGHLGGTNAEKAFHRAYTDLQAVITAEQFKNSFPPMVFHLTDGESSTDASALATDIARLTTTDGQALVVNAYVGAQTNLQYAGPDDFPGYVTTSDVGADDDLQRLFNMSSVAPDCITQNLIADGIFPKLSSEAHLFFDVRTRDMLKHVIQVVGSVGSRADR